MQNMMYGMSDIFFFNVSLTIAYKLYAVTNIFYQFSVNKILPTSEQKKKNKFLIRSIQAISILNLATFVFFITYWTFINRDMSARQLYIFITKVASVLLLFVNSVLWGLTHRLMRKIILKTIIDKTEKKLFRIKRLALILAIVFTLFQANIIWGAYNQGFRDIYTIVNYSAYDLTFTIGKSLVLLMVVRLNLNWKL